MSEPTIERMETESSENVNASASEIVPVVKIKEEIVEPVVEENTIETENTTSDNVATALNADGNGNAAGVDNTDVNTDVNTDAIVDATNVANTEPVADTNADANVEASDSNGGANEEATVVTKMDTEDIEENQPDSAEKQVNNLCKSE